MSNPAGSFIWYELMTPDPAGSANFYGKVAGWNIDKNPAPPGAPMDYRMIGRSDGGNAGGVLGLSPDMLANGARPGWMGYLHVDDVDAAIAAMVADGAVVHMPAVDLPVGRIAMLGDPYGGTFYVMKPIPPAGQPHATSDVYDRWKPEHISWNELYTIDIEGAKAFYAKHFNFEFNSSMPMGPEFGDYWFIDHGGEGIGAMMQKPPFVPVAGWNYYIRVADIDVAKAAAVANGGQVFHGPQEVPGGDWVINGIDPQGTSFALVGKRNS